MIRLILWILRIRLKKGGISWLGRFLGLVMGLGIEHKDKINKRSKNQRIKLMRLMKNYSNIQATI